MSNVSGVGYSLPMYTCVERRLARLFFNDRYSSSAEFILYELYALAAGLFFALAAAVFSSLSRINFAICGARVS